MAITTLTGTIWRLHDTLSAMPQVNPFQLEFQSCFDTSDNTQFFDYFALHCDGSALHFYYEDPDETEDPSAETPMTGGQWVQIEGVDYRTVVITGGAAATSSSLIAWFEANAERLTDLSGTIWILRKTLGTQRNTGSFAIDFLSGWLNENYLGDYHVYDGFEYTDIGSLEYFIPETSSTAVPLVRGVWDPAYEATRDYRTILILGGDDAANQELLLWLRENAVLVENDVPTQAEPAPELLRRVAAALREVTGSSEPIAAADFPAIIRTLAAGGGGDDDQRTLLGQTPVKLTSNESQIQLVGSGETSYTLKSDTVADFDILDGTTSNATVVQDGGVYKITAGSSAANWYQSYVEIILTGLTVDEEYNFIFDAEGVDEDYEDHRSIGHYILYDANDNTLVTRGTLDGAHKNVYAFTATTTSVKLRWYPATNTIYSAGVSAASVNAIYINRSGTNAHTAIVDLAGSFTDQTTLYGVAKGVTIAASPACAVYSVAGSGGGGGGRLPLEGKTIVCFGDSLFGMYRGETSAPAFIEAETGATVFNCGFGGCRMANHPTSGYAEFSMWALADAIASGDWTDQDAAAEDGSDYFPDQLALLESIDFDDVDIVVIHYGTNDFGGGVAIGKDSLPSDHSTICGALRYSIEALLGAYPHLRLAISLPVFRYWESGGTTTYSDEYENSQGDTLPEVVEAMRAVAKEYKLTVIDGYWGLGVNKLNASEFLSDGTHQNTQGRERFGRFIGAQLVAQTSVAGGAAESKIGVTSGSNLPSILANAGYAAFLSDNNSGGNIEIAIPAAYDPTAQSGAALGNAAYVPALVFNTALGEAQIQLTAMGQAILSMQPKNLGAANAGKFLVVGNDGQITAVTMAAWQGGSY